MSSTIRSLAVAIATVAVLRAMVTTALVRCSTSIAGRMRGSARGGIPFGSPVSFGSAWIDTQWRRLTSLYATFVPGRHAVPVGCYQ